MKRALLGLAALAIAVALWWWLRAPAAAKLVAMRSEAEAPRPTAPPQPLAAAARTRRLTVIAGQGGEAAKGGRADGGDARLAGALVTMGQSLALGEAFATNAENADKYVEKFCERSSKLRPLPPAGTRADAAAFLAPRIDYEKPLDQPRGSLHLPDELMQRLRDPAWLTKITEQDLTGRDFSWMAALGQFDHWSVLGAGRLRDYTDRDVLHGPIPNYSSLIGWSRLRYALGLRQGNAAVASAEVRHLADLMRSQGLLIAEMSAIAVYRLDATARQAADAAGQDVSAWPEPDLDDLQRRRDLGFAALDFAYPGVSPETARKAMGCAAAPCTALIEAVALSRSVGGLGTADNTALLNELAAERGCEGPLFDRVNGTHEMATAEALEAISGDLPTDLPNRLGP